MEALTFNDETDGTRTLAKPKDWPDDVPCKALSILDVQIDGLNVMRSVWKPTHEELAALNANGHVILSVIGTRHPAVSLDVL